MASSSGERAAWNGGGGGDDRYKRSSSGRREFYSTTVSGTLFEVDTRYRNLRAVGQGSYGLVCAADDAVTGMKVAIKKVTDAFQDLIDAKRILREIKLLRHLGKHENVISLLDVSLMPPHERDFKDVYIICELMECDLDRIVSSAQPLTDQHAQYFIYQVLRGLKYIHSANVLHRDLKPSNLLVNANCDLTICDFGLARGVNSEYEDTLTEYVVTRWYRAPELLTESCYYGSGVDVWSVGCILGEILLRKPLFKGRDYMHQLQVILESLGAPASESLDFINNDSARKAILNFSRRAPRQGRLAEKLAGCNPEAVDLLSRMLVFDPRMRCTIQEALSHPYLREMHDDCEEPIAERLFDLEFEQGYKAEMPKHLLQDLIFEEMLHFHAEEAHMTPSRQNRRNKK